MRHKNERLAPKEVKAEKAFLAALAIPKRKTKKQYVVALIGAVGAGKSSVARAIAAKIGAAVIEGDAIRIELRGVGEKYDHARRIMERAALAALDRGSNVVLDRDNGEASKRASIGERIRRKHVKIIFVRVVADPDVMFGRIISASYQNRVDDFFGGARTSWRGSGQERGTVVKLREFWRRTPHHYHWSAVGGGKWAIKKTPRSIITVDTSDPRKWEENVKRFVKTLR